MGSNPEGKEGRFWGKCKKKTRHMFRRQDERAEDSVSGCLCLREKEGVSEGKRCQALINHPNFDARMPGRDVTLAVGEPPAEGDPRLAAYKEMQTETRSLLGLLLWVSLAYPQISYHVNRVIGCACNHECRTVHCVSCVFRVLGLA
jgi:hypothetical protein